MEPSDLHFLLLLAQQAIQTHIDQKQIGRSNLAAFHLSYNQQFPTMAPPPHGIMPSVVEFQYDEVEGRILPTVPVHVGDAVDFYAVVKVTFIRNFEEYTLVFHGGFKVGSENVDH